MIIFFYKRIIFIGHNASIISYGTTGSGKSYTIFGEDEKYSISGKVNLLLNRKIDRQGKYINK